MSVLLHAISDGALADPPCGLRGSALEFIPAGSVGVWASPVELDAGSRDDAFDHHRVVEQLCARQPCLPIRFGTRAADADSARTLISSRQDELASALARIGRRRELAVTLLWLDATTRPGRGHAVTSAPGRAFLERKRAGYAADEERRVAAESLARRLEAGLAADQADVRHAYCPSAQVALSTAILAPAGEADAMKERVVRVASALGGVRAVVSGPWPPYTFASAT